MVDASYDTNIKCSKATISGQSHISSSTDALDVSEVNSARILTGMGNITIGGLANGRVGQVVHLIKYVQDNNLIIEHNEATGTQKIYTKDTNDITLTNFGGVTLVFDGTNWFEIAH